MMTDDPMKLCTKISAAQKSYEYYKHINTVDT